jgi:hypothetical protein
MTDQPATIISAQINAIARERDELRAELRARIERLEAIAVLLCEEAARGQGSLGKPFWQFIDAWRAEHGYSASGN